MTSSSKVRTKEAPLSLVMIGHVDHGKSTLIGRLLYDTNSIPESRIEAARKSSMARGDVMEWSFLLDALQLERDQGITVDTTQIWLRRPHRDLVIVDAPGHVEFLRNMITGASVAQAAVLVVDVAEGMDEQTQRHAYLLSLLGIGQVIVAVNKMDLVEHDQGRFANVRDDVVAYLQDIGITPKHVIPVSAREGDGLLSMEGALSWYEGPSLMQALDTLQGRAKEEGAGLRLPVQDILRKGQHRYILGTVGSGMLKVGDTIAVAPHGQTATVAEIARWGSAVVPLRAAAGEAVSLRIDRDLFVERGHVLYEPEAERGLEPIASHEVDVSLFWLAQKPLNKGDKLKLRVATASYNVTVADVIQVVDVLTLGRAPASEVARNQVATVRLHSRKPILFDPVTKHPDTGRGVLVQEHEIVGGCIFDENSRVVSQAPVVATGQAVGMEERFRSNGHRGAVVWMTGLSGSGKSTLALAVQRHLHNEGKHVFVLDGDTLRTGLCNDLGFSDQDRRENIRRAANVARLLAESGQIVLAAFISPSKDIRDMARDVVGQQLYGLVHVAAGVDVCESRDPKGLYARARAGEIPSFTGVSAPYDEPTDADLVIDTAALDLDRAVGKLLRFVRKRTILDARDMQNHG